MLSGFSAYYVFSFFISFITEKISFSTSFLITRNSKKDKLLNSGVTFH